MVVKSHRRSLSSIMALHLLIVRKPPKALYEKLNEHYNYYVLENGYAILLATKDDMETIKNNLDLDENIIHLLFDIKSGFSGYHDEGLQGWLHKNV